MPSFDALIIGGGTNGLACAARLAKGGLAVMVVEAGEKPGGAARGWEFAPGYRTPGLAHLVYTLDQRVASGMNLSAQDIDLKSLSTIALSESGHHLTLAGDFGAETTGLADADRKAWPDLRARLLRYAAALAPFRAMAPPRLAASGNDWPRLARLGLGLRGMGAEDFRELLRMMLTNVWDVLEDNLTDDRLKGLIAFDATLGAWLGPRSPNSLILLLNRLAGASGALTFPVGGMGAVTDAMTRAIEAQGVHLRTGARVARMIVQGDRAVGVALASGEELRAGTVVSAIGPKETFLDLVGPAHLDTEFITAMRHQKARGGAAKLHLALTAAPDFRGADLRARLVIAPSAHAVETAFNPIKYGGVPARPVMEVMLPSAHGAGFAPKGAHVLSAIVQFAPHTPADKDAARAAMLEAALTVLEDHAPGLRALIAHAELLMPYDIEARYGMTGGNWHHGELSVEQMLFLRPLPSLARYATPLPGLWLAGAGSHPGGGISGAAGWNAAERILAEARA